MSDMIKAMVSNKLAALRTSKEGTERDISSLEADLEENKTRINILNVQIKECEDL
mgnify:CR=1 FL=1